MAHRRGKNVTNAPPSDRPEDIPEDCPNNLSWKGVKDNKTVLTKVINQGRTGSCWSISFSKMNAAHLYIHNKTKELLPLSSKHLFGNIKEKFANGNLKNYHGLKNFLKDDGMIVEEDCKCHMDKKQTTTDACNKVKGRQAYKIQELVTVEDPKEVDEKEIIRLLNTRGPIVVNLLIGDAYRLSKKDKDKVYSGPKDGENVTSHLVLLTGYNTEDGLNYFEFQNSWGLQWNGSGYGKFARKSSLTRGSPSLIVAYMWPKLLEQVFDV